MENIYNYVAENVKRVQDEINEVCIKYGRNPEDVILMGVSKTQPVEKLEVAYNAGIKVFGENRVQELVQKADFFQTHSVPCHIIGTLQTNKVKYLPPLTDTIQSVNSMKLADEIEKQYGKAGIPYSQAMEMVHKLSEYKNLTVKGLMCIPPIDDTEGVRKYFSQMHKLFVDISGKKLDNIDMCILSMGMSGDYPWAIAEGSTLVRVGTGIFGARNYNV